MANINLKKNGVLNGRNVGKYSKAYVGIKDGNEFPVNVEYIEVDDDWQGNSRPDIYKVTVNGESGETDAIDDEKECVGKVLKALGYSLKESKKSEGLPFGKRFTDAAGHKIELSDWRIKDDDLGYFCGYDKGGKPIFDQDISKAVVFAFDQENYPNDEVSKELDRLRKMGYTYARKLQKATRAESKKSKSGFKDWDGWKDVEGLESAIDSVEQLAYELRTSVRGSKTRCRTWAELGVYIAQLGADLAAAGENAAMKSESKKEKPGLYPSGEAIYAAAKNAAAATTAKTPASAEIKSGPHKGDLLYTPAAKAVAKKIGEDLLMAILAAASDEAWRQADESEWKDAVDTDHGLEWNTCKALGWGFDDMGADTSFRGDSGKSYSGKEARNAYDAIAALSDDDRYSLFFNNQPRNYSHIRGVVATSMDMAAGGED